MFLETPFSLLSVLKNKNNRVSESSIMKKEIEKRFVSILFFFTLYFSLCSWNY